MQKAGRRGGWAVLLCALLTSSCASNEGVTRLGDTCERSTECASGRCDELVCKSSTPSEEGDPCEHPLECLSENCLAEGSCGAGVRPLGQVCTEDQQCESGGCVQGQCVQYVSPDLATPEGIVSPDAGVDSAPRADQGSSDPDLSLDAGSPPVDTTVDSVSPDTSVDALSPDMSVDTLSPDTSVDTLSPDTSVDTLSPDTTADAPVSSGSCPCTAIFDTHYDSYWAELWPTCTTPETSSPGAGIYPVTQYIEASYLNGLLFNTITIASNSSTSPKTAYRNTCYVMTDGDAYLAGPIAVSDADHMACVDDIKDREVICRGCNWMQDPCP